MIRTSRTWARVLAICGVVLALGGCASGQTAGQSSTDGGGSGTTASEEMQKTDQSQTFDGGKLSWSGKELTVELESNPTTGYAWDVMVTGSGLDFSDRNQSTPDQAANDQDAATDDQADETGVVGKPVTETFTFTGTAKGAQTITLTYKRNWENTDDDKVLTIEVATGDDGTIEFAEGVMTTGAEAAASGMDANTSSESSMATGADNEAVKDAGKGTDADVPNA